MLGLGPSSVGLLVNVSHFRGGLRWPIPVRYCAGRFALRKPCWRLPGCGHVGALLTPGDEGVGVVDVVAAIGAPGKPGERWSIGVKGLGREEDGRGGGGGGGGVIEKNAAHQENPTVLGSTILGILLSCPAQNGRDCVLFWDSGPRENKRRRFSVRRRCFFLRVGVG